LLKNLLLHYRADFIILTGTTGEFFTMSFEERVKIFEVIKNAVGNKIPLMAGVGCVSTMETMTFYIEASYIEASYIEASGKASL